MKTQYVALILVSLALIGGVVLIELASPSAIPKQGVITGTVSIGPFCPVEHPGQSCQPPDLYTSREFLLQSQSGSSKYRISLNETGGFRAEVPVGTYNVSLTNCTFLGCSRVPESVTVMPNKVTTINIHIDTGIR